MQNKKGFVFVETIVVISVVSIALISLFTLFYSVYNEEQKRLSFDNVEDLYATYFVKKYLEENNINRCFINYNSDDLFKEIRLKNGSEHYKVYTVNVYRTGGNFGELNLSASDFRDSDEIDKYINPVMTGVTVNYSENGSDIQICSLSNCADGSDSVSSSDNFERNINNGKMQGYKEPLTFTITVSSSDKCTILHDNDDTNGESFNTMKEKFNIKNLYLVTGDITNLKLNKAKNLLSANVIDYIKTMSKNSSGYYLVSEFENNNVASVKLTTEVSNTSALSTLSANDKLMKSTKTNTDGIMYTYGEDVNNYFKFAGYIWRILRINEDGSIRIILNDKIISSKCSNLNDKLNNFYYDHLSSNSDYIVLSNYCEDNCYYDNCKDIINNNLSFACDNLAYYGQISLNEIKATESSARSFLTDIGNLFWVGAKKDDKCYYYTVNEVSIPGKMGHDIVSEKLLDGPADPVANDSETIAYLRPVISIKGNVILTGDGSEKNPYEIKE